MQNMLLGYICGLFSLGKFDPISPAVLKLGGLDPFKGRQILF